MSAHSTAPTSPPSSPQLSQAAHPPKTVSPKKPTPASRPKRNAQVARVILRGDAQGAARKCRVAYKFVVEDLSPYFHIPQRQAAKLLGVAPITVKRACKRCGIRWPYRDAKLKRIQDARMKERALTRKDRRSRGSDKPMPFESVAARAFARLPFLCMEENIALTGCRV